MNEANKISYGFKKELNITKTSKQYKNLVNGSFF